MPFFSRRQFGMFLILEFNIFILSRFLFLLSLIGWKKRIRNWREKKQFLEENYGGIHVIQNHFYDVAREEEKKEEEMMMLFWLLLLFFIALWFAM